MRDDGGEARLVSTGRGRTTCAFFFPDGRRLIYASTHLGGDACPPPPERSGGYVWPNYPTDEIFAADVDGRQLTRLTTNDGYDAEGAIAPDERIVFTSLRQGDLDLYTMEGDGRDVRRLTDEPGYDGEPFYKWDGRMIVFRGPRRRKTSMLTVFNGLSANPAKKFSYRTRFLGRQQASPAPGSSIEVCCRHASCQPPGGVGVPNVPSNYHEIPSTARAGAKST